MLRAARQSGKFIRLVRMLRQMIPTDLPIDAETVVVGVLERLWHFAATSAVRGDVGRFDDEVIAEACGWIGDAQKLIEMLVECRWLDVSDEHRLVVHDWHDHAPNTVKGNILHAGGFVTLRAAETPKSVTPRTSPATIPRDEPRGEPRDGPRDEPQGVAPPNHTIPDHTRPNRTGKRATAPPIAAPPQPVEPDPVEAVEPPELRPPLRTWLAYKAERRERYRPTGLAALVSRAQTLAVEHGVPAVTAAIERAMAAGWKGFDHDVGAARGSPQRSLPPRDSLDPRGAVAANQAAKEILRREREKQQPATA